MRVRVLFFGIVRERLGAREDTIELAEGATAGELLELLSTRHADFAAGVSSVRVAVNNEYVETGKVLRDQDEIAIIPPVSGGFDA